MWSLETWFTGILWVLSSVREKWLLGAKLSSLCWPQIGPNEVHILVFVYFLVQFPLDSLNSRFISSLELLLYVYKIGPRSLSLGLFSGFQLFCKKVSSGLTSILLYMRMALLWEICTIWALKAQFCPPPPTTTTTTRSKIPIFVNFLNKFHIVSYQHCFTCSWLQLVEVCK